MVRGSNPMEDAVKATINAFVLRIDINKEVKNTENLFWEKIEDIGEVATLSTDWFITMNRNTKKFYWQKNEKIKVVKIFPQKLTPARKIVLRKTLNCSFKKKTFTKSRGRF